VAIATSTEVFDFMGTVTDERTKQATQLTALIAREQAEAENLIGRKLDSEDFTSVLFQNNTNCALVDRKLYLRSIYTDIYTITSIKEEGTALTVASAYNDGNDYYFDSKLGIITRLGQNWSQDEFAVEITGKLGYGSYVSPTFTPNQDVKQAVIEIVAAKSGLWRINVQTEDGDIETIVTTPKSSSMKMLMKHKIRQL